ncbi:MAG: class I SAM-dependent methyltransferase [Nocardioides sp.]|nr:class I SAM-dependent methyltransferase [Nocardioides sp.]
MSGHAHRHGHGTNHPQPESEQELRALFEQPSWEQRYASKPLVWSGNPNPQLVAEASGLAPGRALDIGSGEGADMIWLARQGWQVTGLDFSAVALERSAAHAEEAGVGESTQWRQGDVRTWSAGKERWDLVTSQFMHQPDGGMVAITRTLAAAVAEGGTLLVVGHHPGDVDTGLRWSIGGALFTPEELLPALDTDAWDITLEVREREVAGPEGDPVTVQDSVLLARHR